MRSSARQAGRIALLIAMLVTTIPLVTRAASATTVDEFTWSEVSSTSPSAREGAALAHLTAAGSTVVFGGRDAAGAYLGDTRVLSASGDWVAVAASGPSARGYSASAYAGDLDRNGGITDYDSMVVFGGHDGSFLGDTWRFDGTAWTRYSGSVSPSARSGSQMAYDPVNERIIMFGGNSGSSLLADTWAFNGNTWGDRTARAASASTSLPVARRQAAMAFSPALGQIVLQGGYDTAGNLLADTWAFDVATNEWTQLADFPGGGTGFHRMVTDTDYGRIVMFTGTETWHFDGADWTRATLAPSVSEPSERYVFSMAYDAVADATVVVGGRSARTGVAGDVAGTLALTIDAVSEPAAPVITAVSSLDDGTGLTLTWDAPADGGADLGDYEITVAADSTPVATATAPASATDATVAGLTPGTSYDVSLVATNRIGSSPAAVASVTLNDVTSAPRQVLATAGPELGQITVTWDSPAADNGAPVTAYEIVDVDTDAVVGTASATDRSFVVAGLGNGTDATYAVQAVNAVGTSPRSAVASATTFDVPGAVSDFAGVAGPGAGQVTLTWTAPADDGGTPVLGYYVSRNGNERLADVADTAVTLEVLPGTDYYQVRAYNQVERGPLSDAVVVEPFAAPSAIVDAVVTATGVGELTVTWSTPDSDMAVTGYTVTRTRGSRSTPEATYELTEPGLVDTGLRNGARYTYAITATSDAGTSEATSVTSRTWGVPSRVRNLTATSGVASVTLRWDAPSRDNGSAVSEYWVYRNGVVVDTVAAPVTTWSDTGLLAGETNTYAVAAVNEVGRSGLRSVEGSAFDVPEPVVLVSVPANGVGQLVINWAVPAGHDDGGTPVTSFKVFRDGTEAPIATVDAVAGQERYGVQDSGLADGTSYVYTVVASNAAGDSAPSNAGRGDTWDLPGAPTSLVASTGPNAGELSLSWAAPTDGETRTPVTGYTIVRDGTVTVATVGADTLSLVDTGLGAGATHAYTVVANNAVGSGDAAVASATTFDTPSAPTAATAVAGPGAGEVTLSWSAPADDGGLPVTGYYVSRNGRRIDTVDASTTSYLVTGLDDGASMYFQIRSFSDAGAGDATDRLDVTTYDVPSAPLSVAAAPTPGHAGWITVTWADPASLGGDDIDVDHFTVVATNADTGEVRTVTRDGDSPNRNRYTLTGLGDGQEWSFAVSATNLVGEGPAADAVTASTFSRPDAPVIVSVDNATTKAGVQSVTFQAPADDGGLPITGYTASVYVDGEHVKDANVTDRGDGTFSAVTGGFAPGTVVTWLVTATNDAGTSDAAVATETMFDLPGAPVGVEVEPGNGQVTALWLAPTDGEDRIPVTAYRVIAAGDAGVAVDQVVPASESSLVIAAADGETVAVSVSAINLMGEGLAAEASETSFDVSSAPRNVRARNIDATTADGAAVRVTWGAPSFSGHTDGLTIEHYSVYRDGELVGTTTRRSFDDTGLELGGTYTYSVTATNEVGESAAGVATAVTTWDVPSRPRDVSASSNDNVGEIELTWTVPETDGGREIVSYTVLRDGEVLVVTDAATFSYLDADAGASGYHEYAVIATNSVGDSIVSYSGCARAYPSDTYSPLTICRRGVPVVGRI